MSMFVTFFIDVPELSIILDSDSDPFSLVLADFLPLFRAADRWTKTGWSLNKVIKKKKNSQYWCQDSSKTNFLVNLGERCLLGKILPGWHQGTVFTCHSRPRSTPSDPRGSSSGSWSVCLTWNRPAGRDRAWFSAHPSQRRRDPWPGHSPAWPPFLQRCSPEARQQVFFISTWIYAIL